MRIVLVRNAQHIGERERFLAGKDVGLTSEGEGQTRLLCERLKLTSPTVIYSSDFRRAMETIRPLAEALGLEIQENRNFRPFNLGRFFGWAEQEAIGTLGKETWTEMTTHPDPKRRYFDGGETLEEEAERAWRGVVSVIERHAEGNVVISTHLSTIGCILCRILKIPLNKVWFWGGGARAEHASVTTLVYQERDWSLQHFACAERLENNDSATSG